MQGKKKAIGNAVFLAAVFALTVYGVFHGEDMEAMMEAIGRADLRFLAFAVFLSVFSIWGESVIIWHMMRSFRIAVRKRICFLFSSVGFFSAVLRLLLQAGSQCRFII